MGVVGDGTVVAPFANAAMRLLREDWKGKYGSKMLAEELFPILQTGIPNPDQNFQNFITINAGDTGSFAQLIDKFGNKLFEITAAEGLKPIEPPGYPPPKLKPRIVWAAKTIAAGGSIGAGELDAVAVDPETGAEVDGTYVYTPPDGTTFASAGTATLYVDFTPTDGVKYRRAMGSTVLTITGSPVLLVPIITWPPPADIWLGTALSGTQLNATATDPITFLPVAGVFDYTPPSGTVLDIGQQVDDVFFTPTNTAVYDVNGFEVAFVVMGITRIGGVVGSFTVQAADVIVVGVSYSYTASGGTVAVTDTQGNTYAQIGSYVRTNIGSAHFASSVWYAVVGSSGSVTVTVTPTGTSPSGLGLAIDAFRGVLALDANTSASGTGGETQSAGSCTVNADRELVYLYVLNAGTGFAVKTAWNVNHGIYSPRAYGNVSNTSDVPTPTAPNGGANASVDPVSAGTATAQWACIAASFTHRTS